MSVEIPRIPSDDPDRDFEWGTDHIVPFFELVPLTPYLLRIKPVRMGSQYTDRIVYVAGWWLEDDKTQVAVIYPDEPKAIDQVKILDAQPDGIITMTSSPPETHAETPSLGYIHSGEPEID
jgi:hypothetical protein